MTRLLSIASATVLCLGAFQAPAGTIDSLVGDKDGFGLAGAPAVPANGTLWRDTLGGAFFTDYRDAGDLANAPFTDIWNANVGPTYSHNYGLVGTPLAALLSVQIAGVGDVGGPYDVLFNNINIGQIPVNNTINGFQEVNLYSWAVPVGLLTGADTVSLKINLPVSSGDGYIINFSELHIRTQDGHVPEVTSAFGLLSLGLAGLAGLKRKLAL
jgi:hypothetical protein